ncbi:autophagy-related protein 2 homolog B [Galendromus occidentalis]|uniref:Autophagy-related protein 2 n=1 Tax=Galendromus occidentalis TaxID=34638 RepID=A0AAJ7SG81_9ACAR|nr:autophagy-related protein 2 homolog B [Galendromus occidentalis]
MSWQGVTRAVQIRLCRYVLQRYLGQFLLEKISLDQLSVDLSSSSGNAEIKSVYLDVKGLNELSEANHWPILFVDGFIGSVCVEVPWITMLKDNSHVRVEGLQLTVQPKSWAEDLSLFESMYSSMMSSKQMAEEIFKESISEPQYLTGLEQIIDTMFNRVIVTFENTTLRVEHLIHSNQSHYWTALEVRIDRFEYHDALASSEDTSLPEEHVTRSTKKATVRNVELLVDKFNSAERNEINPDKKCGALCANSPEIDSKPVLFASLKGDQEVEISIEKGTEDDSSPKIGVQVCLSELPIFIEPRQIMMLSALIGSFVGATSNENLHQESPCKALSSADFALMEQDLQALKQSNLMLGSPPLGALGTLHTWAGEQEEIHYFPMSSSADESTISLTSQHPMSVQTEFNLKIGIVFMVILEDTENTPDKSGHFFNETNGVSLRDVIMVATPDFLPYKHFRLALYPVTLNGRTKSSSSHKVLEIGATVANAQLVRSDRTWIESILTSHSSSIPNSDVYAGGDSPFMRLKVNHVSDHSMSSEVTNVSCAFGAIHMKYDRLLESRIIEMFEATPAHSKKSPKKFGSSSGPAHELNLSLTCPQLSCELRFQALEVANVQRKLRPDVLILTLETITVDGKISNDVSNEIKILFEEGYVDYRMGGEADLIQIARVFSETKVDDGARCNASIVIQINAAEHGNLLNEGYMLDSMHQSSIRMKAHDTMSMSFYGKLQEEGPFVTRRVMYDREKAGTEEVILAGDRKQMQTFFENCAGYSRIVVDIALPCVVTEFANRELFEIVYNRVLTDLFYIPNSESQRSKKSHEFEVRQNFFGNTEKSYIDEKFFYSTTDGTEDLQAHKPVKQNLLSLSMTVNEGSVLLGHGHPDKEEFYSFQLNPRQLHFYLVSGYQGDPNVSFVLLHSTDTEVFHSGCTSEPKPTHEKLDKGMVLPSSGSRRLLSRIPKETFGRYRATDPPQEMLCITVKICANPNVKLKNVTLAVSIADTVWRHVAAPARHFWITQLIELFTVRDFPVAGHIPSSVITELHFSLEKSIIDYRPLHIPYNTIVSMENFSLSSNITPKATTSTLRLILEDTSLFVANSSDKVSPTNIPRDYVCLVNAGLVNLCLVITETRSAAAKTCPTVAFTASNDAIHVRTCSDSLFALQSLITYLAADGDLAPEKERSPKPSESLPCESGLREFPPASPLDQALSEEPSLNMNEMMEDAMCESFSERAVDSHSSSRSLYVEQGREPSPPEGPKVYYNPKDDDFLLLEDLPGSGLLKQKGQDDVRVLNGEDIVMIDDFLKIPTGKTDQLKAPTGYPDPVESYTLKEMTLIWHIYGGSDFGQARCSDTKLGPLPSLGGAGRNADQLMELTMTKVQFRHEVYPPDQKKTSRQCLFIKDIQIKDKVATSEMNKFLYQFSNDSLPKQSNANMLTLKITHIASDNECSIFMSLKPLRLNIDQEALMFLRTFFGELQAMAGEDVCPNQPCPSPPTSSNYGSRRPPRIYIRSFEFTPEVPIRLDYHGRHVDLDSGAIAGVLMGIGQFTWLELKLKRLVNKHGILGFDRLVQYAIQEWINDIKKHQVQNVIGGVGPMHSIVQLCSGVKDLFWLPVEQYRKDGQIVRGLQRGTHSFTTNAAIAFLELTGKAIGTIQHAAELAYNLLSPTANVPISSGISEQPVDIREGLNNAYLVMANGINDTARHIVQAAATDTRARGITGAVGEVLRLVPPALVKPVIDVTAATSNVINGVKYQLAPECRDEEIATWKRSELK